MESLTGQSAEKVILPLSVDMNCLQNTDSPHPTVLVKGLDQLISEGGLSVGAASEIQTYLTVLANPLNGTHLLCKLLV